ncbi:DJ-1/PfpI family protein [Nocardioides sp. TF02-7]|uniref:DJ-1/PfpI family protein n=1 Tax=Nocardioides sp. TF02-7 TaxID=2917724 RepID=UPI001F0711AF|nr:DJ-1/PfpI family protein [Nocardioides sp. TF02-7]UMG94089.1 DJ-1/PfpI family protein [Nocardioides sp. TF02-7]
MTTTPTPTEERSSRATRTVAIPLYDGFTALDVVGPYQVLAFTPGTEVVLVAEAGGRVVDDRGSLTLDAVPWNDVDRPDVVVVPGGPGTAAALRSGLPHWVATAHEHTAWTTSVCSGSLVLGAAGLLTGLPATTHYRHREKLAWLGAVPSEDRVVEQPAARIITSAGVSSGIDMALRLVELLTDRRTAQAVQLWTEYDPQPPYDAGSPERAPAEVHELAARFDDEALDHWGALTAP